MNILLIANYEEKGGGISIQVKLLKDLLRSDGNNCDILSTKGSLAKRLKAIIVLLFNSRKYDVFHVHACSGRGFLPAVIGISIGRLLKKRIVLTFHGGGAEGFFRKWKKLVQHYLSRTSANIVLSRFIGRIFDLYGLEYTVIPNTLRMDSCSKRVRNIITPRFISLRSLSETYNIKCTLKAFSAVQKEYPNASLVLLGSGPLKKELEQYTIEQKLQNVSFVGHIPNSEIHSFLDNADIMVSSSRFDNMPVSILEGFKAGLLVIASNVGGVPYMIDDGKNGMLFEDDNDGQMAEKMIEAVENQQASLRMIDNAWQCLDAYQWENCREKLLKLYKG